jgi:hypothetical protein
MVVRSVTSVPTDNDVRAALERVIASAALRDSKQLTAFLRFVVEATLRGESPRIKGYTVAIEALGKAENFDPQTDPIVRITAGRLRRALERYYGEDGATDSVIIDIPRGHYVPTFRYAQIDMLHATRRRSSAEFLRACRNWLALFRNGQLTVR